MGLLNLRELLQFPPGDNATDVVVNGVHFNRSALDYFNYTLYSNNTVSNTSNCYLIFDQFQPSMLSNGSWVNATGCYIPYHGIASRGKACIAFATAFALMIFLTLMGLRKHGKRYLKEDKRYRIVGRRWQWYWMIIASACGLVSCISGIDVDRNYIQHTAIVLQSFFYTIMLPATLAMVWEGVRHWGSWLERQIYDRDPYALPSNDRREKTEFYLPLVFYLFTWLYFFMAVPRSWTGLQFQNSQEQQRDIARVTATDIRWKIASVVAAIAWLIIIFSLHHTLKHYKPGPPGLLDRVGHFCLHCPLKFFLCIVVLAIRLAYGLATAWQWDVSVMNVGVSVAWPFGLGYGTSLLLLLILAVFGHLDQNEDRQLIAQRMERGRAIDAELGIVKKPSWWTKSRGDFHITPEQRVRALAAESPDQLHRTADVELTQMPRDVRNRSRNRDSEVSSETTQTELRPAARHAAGSAGDSASVDTGLTGQTLAGTSKAPAQRIRSMLDV